MPFNVTAIDDVLAAIVPLFQSTLTVPVYDGPQIPMPSDLAYVIIAGHVEAQQGESDAASANAVWQGLGFRVREEHLKIYCAAYGRDSRYPAARALALSVVEQVGINLPMKPTSQTYNALVSGVDSITNMIPAQAGAIVRVQFTITAKSRLVSM